MSISINRVDERPRELEGFECQCAVAVGGDHDHAGIQIGVMQDTPVAGREIAVSICAPAHPTLIALLSDEEAVGLLTNLSAMLLKRFRGAEREGGMVQ